MTGLEILLIGIIVISAVTNYKWQQGLERRERVTRHAEKALYEAVKLQNEQIRATQSVLNGQKIRYCRLNETEKRINAVLAEVEKIAGNFNGTNKRSGGKIKR